MSNKDKQTTTGFDLFKEAKKENPAKPKTTRSRKARLSQPVRFQLVINDSHDDWLATKVEEIRQNGGSRKIKKSAIMRALIDYATESRLDLRGVRDEEELMKRMKEAFS